MIRMPTNRAPTFGYLEVIFFKSGDIALNGLTNILDCLLSGSALADTTGQTWALCHPVVVFPGIENNLAHFKTSQFRFV
jgi:hypothetical protein